MLIRLGLAVPVSCLALSVASAAQGTVAPPCRATQLAGTFAAIYGSAGAGNVSYALRLRNRSRTACFVSGLVRLRLLDRRSRPLPTHVEPAFRAGLTAVRVVLPPGARARATARFSPDVPGVGEPVAGTVCERTAYRLRVTPPPGTGTLVVPIVPPTPVCEHGRMFVSALSAA